MNSIALRGDRRNRIRGKPCGSQVLTGSFDSPTGTERGPYSGLVASKSACPVEVIDAGGSSVLSGPIQTPLKPWSGFGASGLFWHELAATDRVSTAIPNKKQRIENASAGTFLPDLPIAIQ